MQLIKSVFKKKSETTPDKNPNMAKLNTILNKARPGTSPKALFGQVDDDFWFWLHTEGRRQSAKLREILPGMPEEAVQLRFTGSAGDTTLTEAFSRAYVLFKQITLNNLAEGHKLETILDFGCGWGRTIRFFLKDVEPSNLWGIDCFPQMIEICRETNKWSNFDLTDPFPPTSFADNTFDLIYAYSVFSHLSEEAHQKWLEEFYRIMKPGGLLIATTWPRNLILECAEIRKDENRPAWQRGRALAFLDTEQALADYDEGLKYIHAPVGGGDVLDSSFFGETCISKAYVLNHWTKLFKFVDFITDRNVTIQNVIAVKK